MRRAGGVLAAYLVVLQAVLAGVALGAAPAAADPFGVLCRTIADETSAPDDGGSDKSHKALPDCCVSGCALHAVAAAPRDVQIVPDVPQVLGGTERLWADALAPPAQKRTPRNPRAPPREA
ncbi:DUF2946 family protein [Chenggangzhangella methanolivorans]|uniref:DUF2946 domain-containing protein n=1 Tax=Chenggangzhangella methanolivorans TaxID=1437009 RepID=A0A9E6R8H6_9HYPH|nr:DUF2946 family protein [Chenggangzhangella methanolivorans]QZO00143.1 hypothetical protein K6K41_26980 [Chenggangzhangella methanolivorans]